MKSNFVGIDLFSGAGGMSEGAILAGIKVKVAVEIDKNASITYQANHPNTLILNEDIRKIKINGHCKINKSDIKVLFGGPPCQGFSSSNQITRNKENRTNWLFREFLRITKEEYPDWLIIENVKGLVITENGFFFEKIISDLDKLGYTISYAVLNASDYGVPQTRNRVFIIGSLHGLKYEFPKPSTKISLTVNDAISDLPSLKSGASFLEMDYQFESQNNYQRQLRAKSSKAINNYVTANSDLVINRFKHIPQGGNWMNIPPELMYNYKDFTRCHTGIYHRLKADLPSVVIGNYRKNMLIHPYEDRGLSVREAARIQSFPDTFHFYGSIGFQQQQVGNSVPPLLAQAIFKNLIDYTR
jgi:DNA (cytosine-5)-methyltransferase 1